MPGIHFGIGCDHLLESMNTVGNRVLGLDWRTTITDARRRLGDDLVVQGNLDPSLVLAGTKPAVAGAEAVLATTLDIPATSSTSATAFTSTATRACSKPSSISSTNAPRNSHKRRACWCQ